MSPHDGLWICRPAGTLAGMDELLELHYDELAVARSALRELVMASDEMNEEHLAFLQAYVDLRAVLDIADQHLR